MRWLNNIRIIVATPMIATASAYRDERDILEIDIYFLRASCGELNVHECPALQKSSEPYAQMRFAQGSNLQEFVSVVPPVTITNRGFSKGLTCPTRSNSTTF